MNIRYVSQGGAGVEYEIESDRHGNYTIKLGGKVIKRVTAITSYLDKPKWGSRKLELAAVEDAKFAIESFRTPEG